MITLNGKQHEKIILLEKLKRDKNLYSDLYKDFELELQKVNLTRKCLPFSKALVIKMKDFVN